MLSIFTAFRLLIVVRIDAVIFTVIIGFTWSVWEVFLICDAFLTFFAGLINIVEGLLYYVGFYWLTNSSNLAGIVLCEIECVWNKFARVYKFIGLLWDAHSASNTVGLHLVGDQHVLAEDIVLDDLGANDSSDNLASVDANTYI